MSELIEPRVPKGFRDFLPDKEAARQEIVASLARVFAQFGFAPIDTPVLEFAEVLLGKGGGDTDKEVYRFTDHGGRDVAMRYDLTVPFARFMAAHLSEVGLPFRRWHAAKAWRGENTQRGRYREFMQVDFDIVGTDSASADLEILLIMRESMKSLGVEGVTFRYAHRGVFNAFLALRGLAEKSVEMCEPSTSGARSARKRRWRCSPWSAEETTRCPSSTSRAWRNPPRPLWQSSGTWWAGGSKASSVWKR